MRPPLRATNRRVAIPSEGPKQVEWIASPSVPQTPRLVTCVTRSPGRQAPVRDGSRRSTDHRCACGSTQCSSSPSSLHLTNPSRGTCLRGISTPGEALQFHNSHHLHPAALLPVHLRTRPTTLASRFLVNDNMQRTASPCGSARRMTAAARAEHCEGYFGGWVLA